MRRAQLIILESDGWIARQLADLAAENRWLVRQPRSGDAALSLARDARPTVLVVQVEPGDDKPAPFALIADAHRLHPDVPAVAVSDVKLPDADRAAWAALLFDLGARYVLFPPLSKSVLEDVVSGLMASAARRAAGLAPPPPAGGDGDVLDLADDDHDE